MDTVLLLLLTSTSVKVDCEREYALEEFFSGEDRRKNLIVSYEIGPPALDPYFGASDVKLLVEPEVAFKGKRPILSSESRLLRPARHSGDEANYERMAAVHIPPPRVLGRKSVRRK